MSKTKLERLAEILVNYSTNVKDGDVVEVTGQKDAIPLIKEVSKLCFKKGAFVRISLYDEELNYTKFKYASEKILSTPSKFALFDAKNTDVFIHIGSERNTNCFANINPKRIQMSAKANHEAKKIVVRKRWVICDYPVTGLAQDANMSIDEYSDFIYSACLQDWNKISKQCKKIGDLMEKSKEFRIIGEKTDLIVNIKGCPASSSREMQGLKNMPDGEIFTSPNRYLTEGHVYFPWPSKRSKEVKDVYLEFKKGIVAKATASLNQDYLHEVLKTDKLSASLGEIAIGLNYGIKKYTNNILYDEKIGGTIHMAIGAGYELVDGDPDSAVHWDFVKNMSKGEVWFDKKLILKNGKIMV